MVRWYHVIFTAYGFWLPNDPRGSWSAFVRSWELFKFGGGATKTDVRTSIAHKPHDASLRRDTKQNLKYPPVRFADSQRLAIARGIQEACTEAMIAIHAFTVGFDHVHAVISRHEKTAEQIVSHFKARASQFMTRAGCHPMAIHATPTGEVPTPWAKGCWHVFINDERQLSTAIQYVDRHPEKEGLPPQPWPFLTPV